MLGVHVVQIPLARSELHLTELLEDVCNRMYDYGESVSSNGNINFIRTTLDGSGIKLDSVQISENLHSRLKFAVCFTKLLVMCTFVTVTVVEKTYCMTQ